MKLLRNLLFVLGLLFILINTLSVTAGLPSLLKGFSRIPGTAEKAGYLFGMGLLFLVGGVFLLWSKRIDRRMKRKSLERQLMHFLNEDV